jgi:hypothetical protein
LIQNQATFALICGLPALAAMRQTGYLRRMKNGATSSMILRGLDSLVDLLACSGLSHDFIRFGIVGTLGFVWDTATVYAVKDFAGLYIAGACGFVVAATSNCCNFWRSIPSASSSTAARFLPW